LPTGYYFVKATIEGVSKTIKSRNKTSNHYFHLCSCIRKRFVMLQWC